eukprot:GHUV01030119.1.p1 GENE.GHUV01030119.1~~GHUV01030119.1.p1  ORF type:complete len:321 (+),score=73.78 GHUV01030119.1:554-1516(+)
MTSPEAITYSLTLPARTLRSVPDDQVTQWLVGTTSLREENEIRLLECDPATEQLVVRASWVHPEEVWDIACCPGHADKFVTVHSKVGKYGATLWQASGQDVQQLAAVADLPHEGVTRRALWSQLQPQQLLTVEEGALRLWSMNEAVQEATAAGRPGELEQFWTAARHPKDPKLALVAAGTAVQLWDVQAMKAQGSIDVAHHMRTWDVSWAPNNEYRFVSCGDDCKLRFWDTRMVGQLEALLELSGHSHWVWNCCYSPHYDQLLLSSSTDTTVCVWYTPALAKLRGTDAKQFGGGGKGSSYSRWGGFWRALYYCLGRAASR